MGDDIEHVLVGVSELHQSGLALGYEDLNDQDSLRKDLLWQSAVERSQEMASSATLCRLENRAGRQEAWLMHEVLFEKLVNSFQSAPRCVQRERQLPAGYTLVSLR
jgi:Transposase DDE domain group 1